MGFLAALSPGLAVAQLWLPEPSASSSSTHGGGHLLLDDEMAMIEAAPLVLLEYRYGAATAAVNRSSFTSATAGMFRAPSLATLVAQHASSHAVSYSVAWTPGVRVRAEPSLSARVLGLRRSHTLVQSRRRLDTEEGEWVEIEPADATSDGGVGGWVLANGDAVGYGRLLTPAGEHAATHEWCCGRTALQLQSFENVLRTWRSHPLLKLLCKEHALRALPLVATEDACALLGSGTGLGRLLPWRVRAIRGEACAHAALARPPPPPNGYVPEGGPGYEPPKAYEAGENLFDFGKIVNPGVYVPPSRPPPPPPDELTHLHDLCLASRPRGTLAQRNGVSVIGLPEDEVLGETCGGRFESPPEGCALLGRPQVALLRRMSTLMNEAYEEHTAYEMRLNKMMREHPAVNQYVEKRRAMLSVFTDKELKRWFESSGYSSPDLNKTDERQKARKQRAEETFKLQFHLRQMLHALDLSVAQRCRGWSSAT